MAVKLRLTRIGTKKRPYYRLIAADSRSPRNGRNLEILGTYDPMNLQLAKDSTERQAKGLVNVKTDRVQYWLDVGAVITPTVRTLLKRLNLKSNAGASAAAPAAAPKAKTAAKKKAAG